MSVTFWGANIGSNWDGASLLGAKNLKIFAFVDQCLVLMLQNFVSMPCASFVKAERNTSQEKFIEKTEINLSELQNMYKGL